MVTELAEALQFMTSSPAVATAAAGTLEGAVGGVVSQLTQTVIAKRKRSPEVRAWEYPVARAFGRALMDSATISDDEDVWWRDAGPFIDAFADARVSRQLVTAALYPDSVVTEDLLRDALRARGRDLEELTAALGLDSRQFVYVLPGTMLEELKLAAVQPDSPLREMVQTQQLDQILSAMTANQVAALSPQQLRQQLADLLGGIEQRALVDLAKPPYLPSDVDLEQLHTAVPLRVGLRRDTQPELDTSDETHSPPAGRVSSNAGDEIMTWQQAVNRYQQLVLLGDPGLGKTWLMGMHAAHTARASQQALLEVDSGLLNEVVVPVIVRCDSLTGEQTGDLEQACADQLATRHALGPAMTAWLEEHLRDGGGTFLLDALDEVPTDNRDALDRRLDNWIHTGGSGQMMITSRVAGYTGAPLPRTGYAEVELQPYTHTDVLASLKAYNLPADSEHVLRQRFENPGIGGMARIPLLLALLCRLASNHEPLPDTRAGLYGRVLRSYLRAEHHQHAEARIRAADVFGGHEREVEQRLLDVLRPLAAHFANTERGWIDRMPTNAVLTAIRSAEPQFSELGRDAPAVLRWLSVQTGVLVPAGDARAGADPPYLFAHRNFAEYLTADHLATSGTDWVPVVDQHLWFDRDWARVIPLLGGLLNNPAALLNHLLNQANDPLHHALTTAAHVIAEVDDNAAAKATDSIHHTAQRLMTLRSTPDFATATQGLIVMSSRLPPDVVTILLRQLHSESSRTRQTAVDALARRPGEEVVGGLLQRLNNDHDTWVYKAAVDALVGRPGQAVTDGLLRRLIGDPRVRVATVDALARRPGEEVDAGLLARLGDDDVRMRVAAVDALVGRPGEEVVAGLLARLGDDDVRMRVATVKALATRLDEEGVTEGLLARLGDDNVRVRLATVDALARRPGEEVDAGLLARLDHDDSEVRVVAAKALAGRPGQGVTEGLLARLSDDNVRVRVATVDALAHRLDNHGVAEGLLARLGDESVRVCVAAAKALARRPGQEVAAALLQRLSDDNVRVRVAAAKALAGRHGQGVIDGLLQRLEHDDVGTRAAAVDALAHQLEQGVTEGLLARLSDDDVRVRVATVKALATRLDEEGVTEGLLQRLSDDNAGLGAVAVEAWAGLYGQRVIDGLFQRLDGGFRVRQAAVDALARRPGQEVAAALLQRLSDDNVGVRVAAVNALGGRFEQGVTEGLLTRLGDDNDSVQRQAVVALAARREHQAIAARLLAIARGDDLNLARRVYQKCRPLADASVSWPDAERKNLLEALAELTRRVADISD